MATRPDLPRTRPATTRRSGDAAPAPLATTLLLTFVASLGTGVITFGVYFVAKYAHAFTRIRLLVLGLVAGVVYTLGACAVGPAIAGAARRSDRVSTRLALGTLLVSIALVCQIPLGAGALGVDHEGTIWAAVVLYQLLAGGLWPIIESYVSGGRRGAELRSAAGRFNVSWSLATAAAFFLMVPFVQDHPLRVVAVLGVVHLFLLALLPVLGPEPGRHDPLAGAEPHPEIYERLLPVFRCSLPTSYVLMGAISPLLPFLSDRLALPAVAGIALAGTWHVARMAGFVVCERWHGWHGRWAFLVAGVGVMAAGFALAVLSPMIASAAGYGVGRAGAAVGLAGFGLGIACVYAGAFYYAMEVGAARVEAGGSHEALIGAGYAAGPAAGLAAVAVAGEADGAFDPAFVGTSAAMCLLIALVAWGVLGRSPRTEKPRSSSGNGDS